MISFFLKKDGCVGYCEVTGDRTNRGAGERTNRGAGERTNRGAGLELEIPCVYRFYGRQPYIDRLKSLLP